MPKQAPLFRALLASTLLTLLCAGLFVPRMEQQVGASSVNQPLAICPDPTIAEWTFSNTTNPSTGSGIFTNGSGITGPSYLSGTSIYFSSWSTLAALDTSLNEYLDFQVDTTYRTSIQFDFDYRSTGNGPRSFDIYYSIDGLFFTYFSTNTPITTDSSFHSVLVNLSSITVIENSPVVHLRIYAYYATPPAGNFGVDNVIITGTCLPPTITNTPTITDTPTITFTPSETLTPSQTFTPSQTSTTTQTSTPTSTATVTSTPTCTLSNTSTPLSLVINEVSWTGTAASTGDEWIEIYNPTGGIGCTNLTGWVLRSEDGSPSISLSGVIQDDGYFLLERTDDTTVSDITADQIYTGELSNSGEKLYLENNGIRIDSANIDGGSWPAGSTSTFGTMERLMKSGVIVSDSPTTWLTNTGVVKNGLDAGLPNGCTVSVNCTTNPRAIIGTPRARNWAANVTPTPSRAPTSTRTSTPLPTAVPVGRPVINEFLPRPGFDWNQDGNVDVFDEFIEIKNLGPVDINLGGWKLDDEANLGSNPFTLPSVTLKPGERIAFYGLQTNILLSDGGDTVRLLNSSNKVYDSRTYKIAKVEDQSVCRLFPDGSGSWYEDCIPTPNLINSREGEVPVMPDAGFESPVCDLPDTLPEAFLIAECRGYGANLWRTMFWDASGWGGDVSVPANRSKWESFVE